MSVASKLITIAENLQAKLDAINVKLTAKGQTEATNLNEVPEKIEAIETGADVSNVTATASDVLSPKVFVDASGTEQTGTIVTKTSSDLTTSGATVAVPAGYYASDTSKSVATTTQATPSISVSSSGVITASATQSAGYVSSGTKSATKQLSTKSATTYTPSTSNQTISSGYYLTGTQTIKGDSKLVASNIKSGVSIFGVSGSYSGGASVVSDVVSPNSSGQLELYTGKTTAPNYIFLLKYPGNRVTESIRAYRALALWIDIVNDKRYMIQTQTSGMLISSMFSGTTSSDYSFSTSSKTLTITVELNRDDTINTSDFLVVALW